MSIITAEVESYFASLYSRIGEAVLAPFELVQMADWNPSLACCHANADRWIAHNAGLNAIRGWLINGPDESGSCIFYAHSVIEDDGRLFDITPIDPQHCTTKVSEA